MNERVLFDARVHAWLVPEPDGMACYLGIKFRNAPQITVKAAAHTERLEAVGAISPGNLDDLTSRFFWQFQSGIGKPNSRKAINQWWEHGLNSDERQSRRAGWLAVQKEAPKGYSEKQKWKWWDTRGSGARAKLRVKYGYDNGGFFSDVAKAATGPLLDVASVLALPVAATRLSLTKGGQAALDVVAPGTGTAIAKGKKVAKDLAKSKSPKDALKKLASTAVKLAPKDVRKIVDIGSKAVPPDLGKSVPKKQLGDIAKARATMAASSVLTSPQAIRVLAKSGVPPASIFKTASALGAAARQVASSLHAELGKTQLSQINAAAAEQLVRKANPRLSSAQAREQLKKFVFLKVGR